MSFEPDPLGGHQEAYLPHGAGTAGDGQDAQAGARGLPPAPEPGAARARPRRRRRRAGGGLSHRLDQMPIRTRLAAVSTGLTFVILCSFAVLVADFAAKRIRSDWSHQVNADASAFVNSFAIQYNPVTHTAHTNQRLVSSSGRAIRVFQANAAPRPIIESPGASAASQLGLSVSAPVDLPRTENVNGYLVENILANLNESGQYVGQVIVQYARRMSEVEGTVNTVRLLLGLGVVGGTLLAFLAGAMVARRAMAPIARLTSTAGEIARTRDTTSRIPLPDTNDEVAELASTLDQMLRSLDDAHSEIEATLAGQRQFVADASHELRTPLTSVQANLEFLEATLQGDQGDAATSALRSARRMRRLVADLLLLARNDAGRAVVRKPFDLAQVIVEAAGELSPVSADHEVVLDPQPAFVMGARDDVLRLAINLIENALRHTPPGTRITVHTGTVGTVAAELVVQDDGPGVPPEIAPRLFERFVRGAGDRGGSSGLGLAIVRVVARAHGGDVQLQQPAQGTGARFVVRLPLLRELPPELEPGDAGLAPAGAGAGGGLAAGGVGMRAGMLGSGPGRPSALNPGDAGSA